MRRAKGAAILEFALAWPVALLLILGSVELAVWAAESFAARSAALAGARAASAAGSPDVAAAVTLRSLAPSLVGVRPVAWCPGHVEAVPPVWVCAVDLGSAVEVDVGGSVPALVPIAPGGGLPLHAHVVLQKEAFTR